MELWTGILRTLDRVISKIHDVAPGYEGRPAAYIHGVAKKLVLEHLRSRRRWSSATHIEGLVAPGDDRETERRHAMVEHCLEEREHDRPRIQGRRGLAQQSQVSQAALRKRTQRIRERLKWSLQAALRND